MALRHTPPHLNRQKFKGSCGEKRAGILHTRTHTGTQTYTNTYMHAFIRRESALCRQKDPGLGLGWDAADGVGLGREIHLTATSPTGGNGGMHGLGIWSGQ